MPMLFGIPGFLRGWWCRNWRRNTLPVAEEPPTPAVDRVRSPRPSCIVGDTTTLPVPGLLPVPAAGVPAVVPAVPVEPITPVAPSAPVFAVPAVPRSAPVPVVSPVAAPLAVAGGRPRWYGEAIIERADRALRAARKALRSGAAINGRPYLVFFTDGSRSQASASAFVPTPGGYAIVHKIPGPQPLWTRLAWRIGSCFSAVQAELLAHAEAMAVAVRYLEERDVPNAVIDIFTDSQAGIHVVRHGISSEEYTGTFSRDHVRPILIVMATLSERIVQRCSLLRIRWVKRNTNIHHEAADQLAGDAVYSQSISISQQSDATKDLETRIERVNEAYLERRLACQESWDFESFQQDLVARVVLLRRMALGPVPLSFEEELELRMKDNLVGYLIDPVGRPVSHESVVHIL